MRTRSQILYELGGNAKGYLESQDTSDRTGGAKDHLKAFGLSNRKNGVSTRT